MNRTKTLWTMMLVLVVTGFGPAWRAAAQDTCAPDLTAPVITLLGDSPVTVECGTSYADGGATTADDCAGDLTASIVVDNPVNVNAPGAYTVRYNVGDGNGNSAVEMTRTVNVTDTTAPVITLLGDNSATVECGTTYTDAGATAADDCAGDLTASIVSLNSVNTSAVGVYTVTYNVNDDNGNNAVEVTRTVTIADTAAPVITLAGSATVTVECGAVYTDAGATATDACAGTRTVTVGGTVNTAAPGSYTLTYNANDGQGHNAAQETRAVTVSDTTPPVITRSGLDTVTVECGTAYTDAGATATDACAGARTVTTTGSVNPAVPGAYTMRYNANDGNGNSAVEVTRTVTVADTIPPVITLLGSNAVTVKLGRAYTDAGATASDTCAGARTVTTGGLVNTAVLGIYTLSYNVNDGNGNNAAQVTRTVNVVNIPTSENLILRESTWVPNGAVNSIIATPTTTYIGGTFTRVSPLTGGGAAISTATGRLAGKFPNVNGSVAACVSDGNNGWYIGGGFTKVGTVARNYIAHILPDGSLNLAWNPNASSGVRALALSGTTVYTAGGFSTIGGKTRYGLAALDATTGLATAWNPGTCSSVYALAVSGTTVYAGGWFATFGGQTRNNIAALDATTGLATAWNPNAGGTGTTPMVYALAVSGTTVYAGGRFTTIGGQTRNRIAAIDTATGLATAWDPNATGIYGVSALAVSGTTVYAGGSFTAIGGQTRNGIAAIDTTNGLATAWNPNANGGNQTVSALAVSGATVYAGGSFYTIGGQARNQIAALDATTGLATAWNPNGGDQSVNALAVSGTSVYAGGQFNTICGQARNRIAALDPATGAPTDWDPNANGYIYAMAVSGSTVYAGGDFTTIGGQTRNRIAALDATTGLATTWNPNASSTVYALAASGTTVYAGGDFTAIGGQARNRIAALDAASGLATIWNPNASATVYALAVSGTTVHAGGNFSTIGGQTRYRIAALDAATGLATTWNPNAGGGTATVYTLAESGMTVYAGGDFQFIGGQTRYYAAAINTTTGLATAWNPSGVGGTPRSFALTSMDVYAGGDFTNFGGQNRARLCALDPATGLATTWNPNADATVRALAVSGTTVYAGGDFTTIGGLSRPYFAQFIPLMSPSSPGATVLGTDRITWTWLDNCTYETGFQVYVDPGAASPTTLRTTTAPDAMAWQQTGLSENTQYAFQVAAVQDTTEIGRSDVCKVFTGIQAVSGLAFSGVTANAIGVASTNVPANLSSGQSGLYFSNTSTGANSAWRQNNTPWLSTGLSPNTQYTFTGRSVNGDGVQTTPCTTTIYTLAATPVAPLVYVLSLHSAGVDTLDVAVGAGDGNPLTTTYAIQVSPSVGANSWVQADGTVGVNPVYRLAATWDVRRVTGLAKGTAYTFKCVARNGENVDTTGPGTTASTYANVPPSTPVVVFPSVQSDSANLLCSISSAAYDPDGDPVRYAFDWYVKRAGQGGFVLYTDATPLPTVTSQINNTDTLPGDVWHCVVTPWDNKEAGIPAQTEDCSVVLGGVIPSFISEFASPPTATLGEPVTALGQIFPVPPGSGTVAFHSVSPSGVASDLFPEGTVYSAGGYAKQFYPTEASEGRTAWSLTATWPGDDTYQAATSSTVTFTVLKAQPTLSLSVLPSALLAGESDVTATATLTAPLPDVLKPLLANRPVKVYLRNPDGSSAGPVNGTTDGDGVATFSPAAFAAAGVTFVDPGTYQFLAEFDEDDNFNHATSANYDTPEAARVTVKDSAGYAIVCVGRLDENGEGQAEHTKTADFAYRSLRARGFAQDDIYYLREGDTQPAPDILVSDTTPTEADLRQTVEIWAQQKMNDAPGPLYVVLLDHGGENAFYLYAGQNDETRVVTPLELDQWLDTLQAGLNTEASGQDLVVVVGTCHSGSFIPALSRLGRTIIASTSASEVSHRGVKYPGEDGSDVRDGEPFVTEFFRNAAQGKNLRVAFATAAEYIESFTSTETNGVVSAMSPQHPLLDDNGDGEGATREGVTTIAGLDGARADTLVLGYGVNASASVGWIEATRTLIVDPEEDVELFARATEAPATGHRAWIEVKPPDFAGAVPSDDTLAEFQRELPLATRVSPTLNPADGRFEWNSLDAVFDAPGAYKVYYFIRDGVSGETSAYLATTVYRRKADNQSPAPVVLDYPGNGQRVPTWTYFSWQESTDPDGDDLTYRLEVAEDAAFTSIVASRDGLAERYTQVSGLPDGVTLYWRVIPVDAYGASPETNAVRSIILDNTNADLTTTLTGKVTNEVTGAALSGVTVSILIDGTTYTATTSSAGTYVRVSLPQQKSYRIEASKTNYIKKTESFWVSSETAKEVNFVLRPSSMGFRWGDVNNDGRLGLSDAVMMMQWLITTAVDRFPVDPTYIKPAFPPCADVNGGDLNLNDVRDIMLWRVGQLTRVPADSNGDGYGPEAKALIDGPVADKSDTRTVSLQFSGEVARGQVIRIPMVLDDATDLSDWLADVRYDGAVLEFEALENGTLTPIWDLLQANPEPGRVRIAAIQMIPIAGGAGTMVTLRFKVLDTAPPGATSVTLAGMTLNSGDLTATTQPAQFTVAALPGEGEGEATIEGEGEIHSEGEGEVVREGEAPPEGEIHIEGEIEGESLSDGELNYEGEGETGNSPFNCACPSSEKSWPPWHNYLGDLMLLGLSVIILLQWNRGGKP